jgi:hypothetical protein
MSCWNIIASVILSSCVSFIVFANFLSSVQWSCVFGRLALATMFNVCKQKFGENFLTYFFVCLRLLRKWIVGMTVNAVEHYYVHLFS